MCDGKAEAESLGTETEQKKQQMDATKDYIHVRARRGQATDSHSLAERVMISHDHIKSFFYLVELSKRQFALCLW